MPVQGLLTIFNSFDPSIIIPIVVMMILLLCSALISGSEVAFFSLTPADLEDLKSTRSKASDKAVELLKRPKKLLATILIANNFVNVAIVMISTLVVDKIFNFTSDQAYIQFTIQVVAVTFIILLIGEVIPKVYANKYSVKLATIMAFPIFFLRTFFKPLVSLLVSGTGFIDKRIKKKHRNLTVDELEHALDLTEESDIKEDEQKILRGIVKFGNTDVKQIMKPRMDVIALEDTLDYDEVRAVIIDSGYSRIPVYKENFDKITGVLYIKDLLNHLKEKSTFKWQDLQRQAFFVPENKKIDDLLTEFQDSKIHIAIVIDEYGGTLGIVTLEDVIEEIVGDITDEFDDDDIVYSKLDDYNYVFEGKTPLVDVYKVLDIEGDDFEESKGDSDTLAGFLLEQSGKILKKNERLTFNEYTFTIESADKRRIKRIKITLNHEEKADS